MTGSADILRGKVQDQENQEAEAEYLERPETIPAGVRICDEIGASGHIPVKHLANSNGSRYNWTLSKLYARSRHISRPA